jgi:hypothetical protein
MSDELTNYLSPGDVQPGGLTPSGDESGLADQMMNRMLRSVNDADAGAAFQRVQRLRVQNPDASVDELAEQLIRQKAIQAGLVGAVTAGAALAPGVGTITSIMLGTAADVSVTMRLQTELTLELAALHGRELSQGEWRNAIMLVSGASVGAEQVMTEAGRQLARKASTRFAGRSFLKAIPVFGVFASGGANVFSTYVIGRRANAYFSLGPEAMEDPAEILRALSGVDERKLIAWTGESVRLAGDALRRGAAAGGRKAADLGMAGLGAALNGASSLGAAVARRRPRRRRGVEKQ